MLRGQMGDVGKGACFDFPVFSEGLAEEDGGRGVAIGHSRHVHAYMISQQLSNGKRNIASYMPTYRGRQFANDFITQPFSSVRARTSG